MYEGCGQVSSRRAILYEQRLWVAVCCSGMTVACNKQFSVSVTHAEESVMGSGMSIVTGLQAGLGDPVLWFILHRLFQECEGPAVLSKEEKND